MRQIKIITLLLCAATIIALFGSCSTPTNNGKETGSFIGKFVNENSGDHGSTYALINISNKKLVIDYYPDGRGVPPKARMSELHYFQFNSTEFNMTNDKITFTANGESKDAIHTSTGTKIITAGITGTITKTSNGINVTINTVETNSNGSGDQPDLIKRNLTGNFKKL